MTTQNQKVMELSTEKTHRMVDIILTLKALGKMFTSLWVAPFATILIWLNEWRGEAIFLLLTDLETIASNAQITPPPLSLGGLTC